MIYCTPNNVHVTTPYRSSVLIINNIAAFPNCVQATDGAIDIRHLHMLD